MLYARIPIHIAYTHTGAQCVATVKFYFLIADVSLMCHFLHALLGKCH